MDYSKLSDHEINVKVGSVIGFAAKLMAVNKQTDYCNNPADAWPIIDGNGISINHYNGVWEASFEWDAPVGAFGTDETVTTSTEHKNPLRAAMVAYLMMREVANVQTDSTR